jgi:hypothetical protein
MADSPVEAQARLIYEEYQAQQLAATPLCAMADWVATGAPPPAEVLRARGFATDGPEAVDPQRWVRKAFIRAWGFAIPCAEAVSALRGRGPLVEVGCGTGYWTALLGNAGLDVIATDPASGRSGYGFQLGRHAAIETLAAADAVRKYPERNLFCAWPSAGEPWAFEAAALVEPGRLIAMVLDERPEVTGDAALADFLDRQCELLETVVIPQFLGVQDRLLVHRRR